MSAKTSVRDILEGARRDMRRSASAENRKMAKIVFNCQNSVLDGVLDVWDRVARIGRNTQNKGR